MTPVTLCYLGADAPWTVLRHRGFRRRNTCLLKALGEHPAVDRVYNVRWVLRPEFLERMRAPAARDSHDRVVDVFVCTLLPERDWFPSARFLNRLLYRVQIGIQTRRWSFGGWIVWCHWPDGFRLARRIGLKGTWVFDADHDLLHDENRSAGDEEELRDVLRNAAADCDIVVAASRSILEWFERNGARATRRLRNGARPMAALQSVKERDARPRIGYLGTLSGWLDYDLLCGIVASRRDWTFVIGGSPYQRAMPESLKGAPNVHFIGDVHPDAAAGVLERFDVALALYRREPWLDGDSMKLFDYLAAGVPVVSTRYHDYLDADFDGLIEFAGTPSEFVTAIERLLARDEHTAREWHERRRRFLAANGWSARADEAIGFCKAGAMRSESVSCRP
jgi:glycosyltransferase involved in cell wall biosynthesis